MKTAYVAIDTHFVKDYQQLLKSVRKHYIFFIFMFPQCVHLLNEFIEHKDTASMCSSTLINYKRAIMAYVAHLSIKRQEIKYLL